MAISKRQLGRILLALLSLFIHFGCRSFGPPYHLRPSNDRDWIVEHGRIPHVAFDDNWIHLCNVRDFHHTGKECFHPCYRHISIDSCSIETVDLFISYPVRDPSPFAHTFLSFGTKDSEDFYILSVEARREKGEKYQPIAGMMRKFDLIYVIATERDMLDQRAHWNEEKVHRYPIQVEPRHARSSLSTCFTKFKNSKPILSSTIPSKTIVPATFSSMPKRSAIGTFRIESLPSCQVTPIAFCNE